MLMFMAVGVKGHWKVPIAYFLTAGLSAGVQGKLVTEAIEKLHAVGIRCLSVVMDGHATNQSMVKCLGGSLKPQCLKSSFPHPCNRDLPVLPKPSKRHHLCTLTNQLGTEID